MPRTTPNTSSEGRSRITGQSAAAAERCSLFALFDVPIVDDVFRFAIVNRTWNYTGNWNRFQDVTFIGNTANCPGCTGGALYIESGQTLMQGGLFEENRAGLFGGAIAVGGSSTSLLVENTSFVRNDAPIGWDGPALLCRGHALHLCGLIRGKGCGGVLCRGPTGRRYLGHALDSRVRSGK